MSVQCCPLSSYDEGAPSFRSKTIRRANKPHVCDECREAIAKGDRYEYVSGKWDGDILTVKTCLSCVEIRDHFACDGWVYGRIWEDLQENFFPTMKAGGPCMEGLSPAAKARLFERRMAWLEAV